MNEEAMVESITKYVERASADFVRTMAPYMKALGLLSITMDASDKGEKVGSVTLRVKADKKAKAK